MTIKNHPARLLINPLIDKERMTPIQTNKRIKASSAFNHKRSKLIKNKKRNRKRVMVLMTFNTLILAISFRQSFVKNHSNATNSTNKTTEIPLFPINSFGF